MSTEAYPNPKASKAGRSPSSALSTEKGMSSHVTRWKPEGAAS
jgi:hypothetical protein